ncbi:MAG: glycoside hydrolase domain-containing protein [Planctomycetota bacterium]
MVYINGEEVARKHLPAGPLEPDTPAEDYHQEAYVTAGGEGICGWGFGHPETYKDRIALRGREVQVKIPAAKLRKGANVIAVEVHRAPVSEIMFTSKWNDNRNYVMWDHIGCGKAVLTAPAGSSVVPNAGRPTGIQVWTQPVVTEVRNTDFGDPPGPPRPVEIRGARNGAFSGQIVAGSDAAIKGLKVTVTNLKGARDGSLPASAIQVRYAVLRGETEAYGSVLRRFDGLEEKPPEEVATDKAVGGSVQPVWITVRVPRDAAGGRYEGKAVVSADGVKPVEVPITLNVADWALPDPKDYATFIGLIQSPESLALQYTVDRWSEAHWKMIDRSFELLGRIGTKDVYIPIRARTYFGNEHSISRKS